MGVMPEYSWCEKMDFLKEEHMSKKWIKYICLTAVAAISAVLVFLRIGGLLQDLASIPLYGALLAVVVTIVRDDAAHQRTLLAADHQNRFVLGGSSHMASVAFDKHVEFCEEYVHEADAVLAAIFREGPSEKSVFHAGTLFAVRRKHAVWITEKIDEKLASFEAALRQMGVSAGYVASTIGDATTYDRQEHINQKYKIFAQLTGSDEWRGETLTDELAITSQIKYLRTVLGTEDLNYMRQTLVMNAKNGLPK